MAIENYYRTSNPILDQLRTIYQLITIVAPCIAMESAVNFLNRLRLAAITLCLASCTSPLLAQNAALRGPVAFAAMDNGHWITVNQLSSSLSCIDPASNRVLDEIAVGDHPTDIAQVSARSVAVVCRNAGTIEVIEVGDAGELSKRRVIQVGYLPIGIAVHPTSGRDRIASITLSATGEVANVDLVSGTVESKFKVGSGPSYLAVTPDSSRLAIALGNESRIAIHDARSGEFLHDALLSGGINLGRLHMDALGNHVYFPWMIYRTNPINPSNIRRGWVLASRIARVNVAEEEYREAMSLDVLGEAVADPHCVDISKDGKWMVCSSAGTHELLVYRMDGLPLEGAGGPGDLIDARLSRDKRRFFRIPLGGRPMMVQFSGASHRVVVANHLDNALQVVNLDQRKVTSSLSLGPKPTDRQSAQLARGREIFYDAQRSLDQWYSCHSCHQDGGTNAKPMDTFNDGSELTTKTVLPLWDVTKTGPWTWHGWQEDLTASLQNSFVSTMQGKPAQESDLLALKTYISSLRRPPNPFRESDDAKLATAGKLVFDAAGCADCHSGTLYTDGQIHDVGLGSRDDAYDGFNTPSLRSVHLKPRLLHDGRSKSLRDMLENWHRPQDLGNEMDTSDEQLEALIAYLKTL
ncbi:MAG: hypothetical protein Aurels2KO_33860 [Aureliella sp.]